MYKMRRDALIGLFAQNNTEFVESKLKALKKRFSLEFILYILHINIC